MRIAPRSVSGKQMIAVAGCYVLTAAVILFYSTATLKHIILQEKTANYGERLELILGALAAKNESLDNSNSEYLPYIQNAAVEQLRESWYTLEEMESYPFILDTDGNIVMHPELKAGAEYPMREQWLQLVEDNPVEAVPSSWQGSKRWVFRKTFGPWEWVVLYAIPESMMFAPVRSFRNTFYIVTILSIIVALAASGILIDRMIKPLRLMSTHLHGLASGGGNLKGRIPISQTDEIGICAAHFNRFIKKLAGMIGTVADSVSVLSTASGQLVSSADQSVTHAREIAEQAAVVSRSGGASAEGVEKIAGSTRKMSLSLSEIATAIEQLSASINGTARSCRRESHIAARAYAETQQTSDTIAKLNDAGHTIRNVADLINQIADQTNLLAINAAIEAASAGEAGKGFAVVANEVKVLARRTAEATSEIEKQVYAIEDSAKGSARSLASISDIVQEVNAIAGTIAAAVEEQSATVAELSVSLNTVNGSAAEIAGSVEHSATELSTVSQTISRVSSAVQLASNSFGEIHEAARQLSERANVLQSVVGEFEY
jgi:methyl-accepting chemotaxis protein